MSERTSVVQEKLNAELAKRLAAIAAGLAGLYVLFTVGHFLVLEPPVRSVMVGLASVTASLFGLTALWLWRRPPEPGRAHGYALGFAFLPVVNSLVHLYLLNEFQQTTNVLLIIVALGSFFLALRWLLLGIAVIVAGWTWTVMLLPPTDAWVHYAFALMTATVLSILIFSLRVRALRRLEWLRLEDAERSEVLQRNITSLQQSEERFRRLAEASLEGVALIHENELIEVNARLVTLLGSSVETLLGQDINRFIARPDLEKLVAQRVQGVVEAREITIRRPDGSSFAAEVIWRDLPYGQELIQVALVRDLSERLAAEEALRQKQEALQKSNLMLERANRLKSEFLANVSHELRTPLTAVIGFSELLAAEQLGDLNQAQREGIGDIHTAGKHLLGIINTLLDLSSLESERLLLEPREVDINDLVEQALGHLKNRAGEKAIELEWRKNGALHPLVADPYRITQVLMSYLSNAVKFTPEGGRVVVSVADTEDEVRVEVSDTGIGIAQDDMKKLFKPFSQVDSSTARAFDGMGLSLALSKRLINLHGGEVWVESEPGEGSRFGFSLPREGRPAAGVGV